MTRKSFADLATFAYGRPSLSTAGLVVLNVTTAA